MIRDVFYYGAKPNAHPREKHAIDLADARKQCTTEHFWIINEYCDYINFDWDWDFDFLPDEDVWAEEHNNVWPSPYQKDSGTWLCPEQDSQVIIYRADVEPVTLKDVLSSNWKIIEAIDKSSFDFKWHPDPTEDPYIYVFGNQWYSGIIMPTVEYHVLGATNRKYIKDKIAQLLPMPELFNTIHETVDFDYSWRPDPTSPPYIYVFGNTQYPATIMPTIEYHVEGATEKKYIENFLPKLKSHQHNFNILEIIDRTKFDFSWVPDPTSPPYIYVFGNTQYPATIMPTIEYAVEGATERKYVDNIIAHLLPMQSVFNTIHETLDFDYSWRPDPTSPPYIYVFGNTQYPGNIMPTIEYVVEGATERKYVDDIVPKLAPQPHKFQLLEDIDTTKFDFSWVPNPTSPPYIYAWGNQWNKPEDKISVQYVVEGATEYKYMEDRTIRNACINNWQTHDYVLQSSFDYSWEPNPNDPPYIYQWGNKHYSSELQPTIEYIVSGATSIKHMSQDVKLIISDKWIENYSIDKTKFDMTWRPDPTSPPYIYVWGNKHIAPELKSTLEYHVEGAIEIKYMTEQLAVLPEFDRWHETHPVDRTKFDLTWRPDPREPNYIYVWGNKWIAGELESSIEYHCPGATEKKYMETLVDVLPQQERWNIVQQTSDFDYSWRPDPREPAYIYVWGNKHIAGELKPTVEYYCPNATERKYMGDIDVVPEMDRWNIVQDVGESFDLSWRPDPREPAYIYVWGNKWISGELKSTIEYHCPDAIERKYMGDAEVIPEHTKWKITQDIDKTKFDMSWRPDPREPAYIYVWGNKHIDAELKPTIEYYCEGATERKYMGTVDVLPEFDKWVEVQPVDKTKFDLTWRPDPREPAYIYVWGNKWISGELKSTIEYHCLGSTDKKYMGEAEVMPISEKWKITQTVDNFDFTWRPDPREPDYIYVWGNKWISGELKPTIEFYCPNATNKKYMGDVDVAPEWDKYQIFIPVDKTSFDFTWRPDPREPAFIYVWGNQSNSAIKEPTIEYHCPGATERKYMEDTVAKTLPVAENWKILIPVDNFDFSWRPDPNSPPYIYVFGNQWHDAMTEPTLEYHVKDATEKKFVTDIVPKASKTQEYWNTLIPVESFDYSWRPNPHSTPYIYVFGNQWHDSVIEPSIEYHQPGATDKKYIIDIIAMAKSTATESHWKRLIPIELFDYSWRPDPKSPPYIYVFGNKWNDATTEPSIEYHVQGSTEYKYMADPVATPQTNLAFWSINNNDDLDTFDFTWRPNPHSPPQIYQWADNGPRYTMPDATEVVFMERTTETRKAVVNRYKIKTTLEDLIAEHPEEVFWAINPDLTYDKFDFSWRPNEENFRHVNAFGNEYSINTQTYYVNGPLYMMGHTEFNYVEGQTVEIDSNLSMFYIDRGNSESAQRFEQLKTRYPQIQKTRYLNTWVDTINRCVTKSNTNLCWILNSELDYTEFEFDFYPSPWQQRMVHVFGTQWSHWGTTFMVNKESFPEDTKYVKIIEHLNVLNFVKSKKAKAVNILYDVVYIDHGNMYPAEYEGKTVIKYDNSYLKTFKKLLEQLPTKNEHYIWIASSVCDYSKFDFTYIGDPYAREHLHVFPSDKQKFGDTFLVNVNKLRLLVNDMITLEDYGKINYNQHQFANRLPAPSIITIDDTHCKSIQQDFDFPYAVFTTTDNSNMVVNDIEPMSLWSPNTKNIIITSSGGSRIIVPKEAKSYINEELYDYPYITKVKNIAKSNPLDIVFLSNGETGADDNYKHLLKVTDKLPNRVVRVDGVNGRVQAYHAAAEASNTPWMFTVFAKLQVDNKFDFSWQPDRLQIPKHYIFHATNPVNGLEYGHQAMIAYNKQITLSNMGKGLDFTLDNEHEVVELNSGVAQYNTDEFSTWRTSFREAIKLRLEDSTISRYRLNIWSTVGKGDFAQYSINGALDAVEYFEQVNGELDKLRLSYDWPWLKEYFNTKYN